MRTLVVSCLGSTLLACGGASAPDAGAKEKTAAKTEAAAKDTAEPAPTKPPESPPVNPAVEGATAPTDGAAFKVVDVAYEKGKLPELLAAEAVKAKALGLRPHAEFWAEWCGPCKKLEAGLEKPLLQEAFAGTYVIRLNNDDWSEEAKGVGFPHDSIPVFYGLDAEGKATEHTINGGAWGEDTPENMAPPLAAFFKKTGEVGQAVAAK